MTPSLKCVLILAHDPRLRLRRPRTPRSQTPPASAQSATEHDPQGQSRPTVSIECANNTSGSDTKIHSNQPCCARMTTAAHSVNPLKSRKKHPATIQKPSVLRIHRLGQSTRPVIRRTRSCHAMTSAGWQWQALSACQWRRRAVYRMLHFAPPLKTAKRTHGSIRGFSRLLIEAHESPSNPTATGG